MAVYIKKVPLEGGFQAKIFFLSEKANFSASDQLGKNFPAVQTGPEKTKNQIKLVSK